MTRRQHDRAGARLRRLALAFGLVASAVPGLAAATAQAAVAPLAAAPAAPPATATPAIAVSADGASAAPAPAAIAGLPANTRIELEVVDGVSSRTAIRGTSFRLKVREAVVSNGVVLIPAGTPGLGEVVHAQRKGIGGKPGELIVAARRLDLPSGPLRLRSSFGAAGDGRQGAAAATVIAIGVLGLLVTGKDTELPAGAALSARTAEALASPSNAFAGASAGTSAVSTP